jgi:hypothetical protein
MMFEWPLILEEKESAILLIKPEDGKAVIASKQPGSKKPVVYAQAAECALASRPLPSMLLQEASVRCTNKISNTDVYGHFSKIGLF